MDGNDEDNDYDKNNFHNNDSYSYSFLLLSSHSKIALNKVNRVEWHLTVVCFPPIALLGNSNCVSFEGNMESKVLIWTSGALRSSRSSQTWTPLLVVMLPGETCCKWVLSPNPSQIYWCCTEKDRQVYLKCFMHWLYTLDWIVCLLSSYSSKAALFLSQGCPSSCECNIISSKRHDMVITVKKGRELKAIPENMPSNTAVM